MGEARIDIAGDATLAADAAQLSRLFSTLFENAVLAGASELHVAIESTSRGARVQVDDDGPGVPEALRATLFEAFVTGRGRDAPRPGTGLGLAIARGIAERHGGRLELGAPEGAGARFVLTLPRVPMEAS